MCTFYFFRPMTVTQKKLWQVCLHLLAWWICPKLTNTKFLSIISWILQWTQWTYILVTTHEGIGELTSASLPSVTLPNQELLAPNFQISHCYLTEKMSTSAAVPTVFTTHQVSSSFRRNAAIDKNNLSVIISYICQWENISGMRAWMAYQCFVMLFNGSISCCWWPGAIWQQELLLLLHPVYHITWSTLVQVIACYMLNTKPLSESML